MNVFVNKKHYQYLESKAEQINELLGCEMEANLKSIAIGTFVEDEIYKIIDFSESIGIEAQLIFDNFDLFVELDELIDYDVELAKERVREVLK